SRDGSSRECAGSGQEHHFARPEPVHARCDAATAVLYRDSVRCRKNPLPTGGGRSLLGTMIGGGFLTAEERQDLTELARDGLAEHRLGRRANPLVRLGCGGGWDGGGRGRWV